MFFYKKNREREKKVIEFREHLSIGEKVFSWTVIDGPFLSQNLSSHHSKYLCECECGERSFLFVNNLVHGRTKSCRACSCLRRRKITSPGVFIGLWKVLDTEPRRVRGRWSQSCQCICGTRRWIRTTILHRGLSIGCAKCILRRKEGLKRSESIEAEES